MKNLPKRLDFFGASNGAAPSALLSESPEHAGDSPGVVVPPDNREAIVWDPGLNESSKRILLSPSSGSTFTTSLVIGQTGMIFNGGGAGFRFFRERLRLLLLWRLIDLGSTEVLMMKRAARAGLRGGQEVCEQGEGGVGVGGTAITSLRKPGLRCLPRLGRDGTASRMLGASKEGEGKTMEPAIDAHLIARPRANCSGSSSVTNTGQE